MTAGLLQRLAEQALGLAQPLRSQRAAIGLRPAQDLPAAAETQVAPNLAAGVRPTMPETVVVPPAFQRAEPAERAAPAMPPVAAPVGSPRHPAAAPHDASSKPEPIAGAAPFAFGGMPNQRAVIRQPQSTPSARTEPAAPLSPGPTMAGPQAAASAAEPARLLPERHAVPSAWASWPPDGRRPHEAAREAPAPAPATEVHVSIGRIELIAQAPSPSPTRPVPRARETARSLADYLRPGNKGQA